MSERPVSKDVTTILLQFHSKIVIVFHVNGSDEKVKGVSDLICLVLNFHPETIDLIDLLHDST